MVKPLWVNGCIGTCVTLNFTMPKSANIKLHTRHNQYGWLVNGCGPQRNRTGQLPKSSLSTQMHPPNAQESALAVRRIEPQPRAPREGEGLYAPEELLVLAKKESYELSEAELEAISGSGKQSGSHDCLTTSRNGTAQKPPPARRRPCQNWTIARYSLKVKRALMNAQT